MKIGIDIDGVLTNVEQFSIDYFSKYCFENNIEYNISHATIRYRRLLVLALSKKMIFGINI